MAAPGERSPFTGPPKVGDFFAPFFTARFLTVTAAEGQFVDPDTGGAAKQEVTEAGEIVVSQGDTKIKFGEDQATSFYRSFATKLQVTFKGGDPSGAPGGLVTAELTLEPPWEDAQKLIEDRRIHIGTIMVIQWGYSSNDQNDVLKSEKHFFQLTQPKLEVRGLEVSLTLTGVDMFGGSAPRRTTRFLWRRSKYPSDATILKRIAQKNNLKIDFSLAPLPGNIVRIDTGARTGAGSPIGNVGLHKRKPSKPEEPDGIEQHEKDLHFFNRLCEQNNCSWFVSGDKIFVVDNNIARTQKAAYRLLFFMPLTTDRDIPIIGFTTQVIQASLFPPAAAYGVECKRTDEDMKMVVTDKIDPAKMDDQRQMGPRTAAGAEQNTGKTIQVDQLVSVIPNPKFTPEETGHQMSCPNSLANRDESAKAVARRAETLANTNMDVNIPGVPSVMPMQVVRVEGVGKVFSGPYLILKVVHKIGTDGYDCDLTLIREASSGDNVAGAGIRPVTGGTNPPAELPGEPVVAGGPDQR